MQYDFNQIINRQNTGSVKWDLMETLYGSKDVIPLWVADMDFICPQPVINALQKRAGHGIFGYTLQTAQFNRAVKHWLKKRHQFEVEEEWIFYGPGVVPSLNFLIQEFTRPGDRIMIQTPVYHVFHKAILNHGRSIVENPLSFDGTRYNMDFSLLKEQLEQQPVKLLILCSPHNPVSRVWTKEELLRLAGLCRENNVLIISDEIHFDLVFQNQRHWPLLALSEEISRQTIICSAPSKTFNLGGMQTSYLIIKDEKLQQKYKKALDRTGFFGPSPLGEACLISAYQEGEEWLEQLLVYLEQNYLYLKNYIQQHMPCLKVIPLEATYLVWIDCRQLKMSHQELAIFMQEKAKIGIENGSFFGSNGRGFIRINIACPKSQLEQGLHRLQQAIAAL